jgi:hypothetical protein
MQREEKREKEIFADIAILAKACRSGSLAAYPKGHVIFSQGDAAGMPVRS